jgi:hypothetical protein
MSVHMQWILPNDGQVTTNPHAFEDDVHGVRMCNAAGAYIGEEFVIYGEVSELRAWHERIGAALDAIEEAADPS